MTGLTVVGTVSAEDDGTGSGDGPIEPEFPQIRLTERRIAKILGGGDFIGITNEDKDSMIGILYGTEAAPNNVYMVSIFTRYLGTADVYEDGELERADHPIPVRTILAQRFGNIFEFDDANGDGMYDSQLEEGDDGDGGDGEDGGDGGGGAGGSETGEGVDAEEGDAETGTATRTRERVYKMVNTRTAWSASEIREVVEGEGRKGYTFRLTAQDLEYYGPLGFKGTDGGNQLEELQLIFHLAFEKKEVTKEDVPVYRVEVAPRGDGNYDVEDVEPQGNRTYKGVALDASFKYDTSIQGWDFDGGNGNPSLLMGTQVMFSQAVSDEAARWMREQFTHRIQNGNGSMQYDDRRIRPEDGNLREGEFEDGGAGGETPDEKPSLIRKNKLTCADNWQRVGRLEWVNNVTVDGQEKNMYFQVYGARSFTTDIPGRGAMAGFGIAGGFTYPGGGSIVHDPVFATEVFTLGAEDTGGDDGDPIDAQTFRIGVGFIIMCAIASAIGVAVLVGVVRPSAGRRSRAPSRMDNGEGFQDEEEYYDTYFMDRRPPRSG